MILDAAFIIELLLRYNFCEYLCHDSDPIFKKPWMYLQEVWPDMLLLENQLPLVILEDLFDPAKIGVSSNINSTERLSIVDLSYNFFKSLLHTEEAEGNFARISSFKVEHFVHLWRNLYVPNDEPNVPPARASGKLRLTLKIPSMTELYWAGVAFKVRSTKDLFDIRFSNGVLENPKLAIGKEIYIILRNLLAYEQCHCVKSYINDYVALLDRLVHTPKDMALLVECGIVEDRVGDSSAVSTLVNNLVSGVIVDPNDFYFALVRLCDDLNMQLLQKAQWKAALRQYLYNKRWEAVSISAVVSLLLTIVQTVCSIAALKHQPS